MITAPFNFVPLNEKVFYPPWAEDVSHDVPFEDGESGVIDITMTAKSPIFIRDHESPEEFCQYNGEYYIPSSSIKGMVRNVLEIMSFSKMNVVDDKTYAVRDLSSSDNFYMSQMKENIFCAWLKKDGDNYILEDCGIPLRIHHKEIDKATNKAFASYFNKNGFEKTSEYKYNLLGGTHKSIKVGESYKSKTNSKNDKRLFCKYDKDGKNATLVVTGQQMQRKETGKPGDGKGFEFIFTETKKELKVSKKVFENFLFAYFDKRTTEPKESPDWTFWKEKLSNGEKVPVFFQKKGAEVAHFGLSYLYKLPYSHSVINGIPSSHFNDIDLDMAQTIFGYTNKENSLKGRVQFSHFKAISNIKISKSRKEILGTPRASYYPIYVRQQDGKLFSTFMNPNFQLAGRKRYPIHGNNKLKKTETTGNENVGTTFSPIDSGVVFKGKFRYHNLKKAELGAVLSALTFHNTSNTFHNIGMAKSLGYGKISLKIKRISEISIYLKEFELAITEQVLNWKDSEQLKELITMATEQDNSENSNLEYMSLQSFAKHKTKKNQDYLRYYSKLENIQAVSLDSYLSKDEVKDLEVKYKLFLEMRKVQDEKRKKEKKLDEKWNKILTTDDINLIKSSMSEFEDSPDKVKKANEIIEKLEAQEKVAKDKETQQEANTKWESIQKVDEKYKQKAFKDFIINYPNSTYIEEAKVALQSLKKEAIVSDETSLSQLKTKKDFKGFKSIIIEYKQSNKLNLEDKKTIKNALSNFYQTTSNKNKKKFLKEMKLSILVDLDFENEVKKELNL